MTKKVAYLGLDVHKKTFTGALNRIDKSSFEFEKTFSSNIPKVVKIIKELAKEYDLRICYEAGGLHTEQCSVEK